MRWKKSKLTGLLAAILVAVPGCKSPDGGPPELRPGQEAVLASLVAIPTYYGIRNNPEAASSVKAAASVVNSAASSDTVLSGDALLEAVTDKTDLDQPEAFLIVNGAIGIYGEFVEPLIARGVTKSVLAGQLMRGLATGMELGVDQALMALLTYVPDE